MWVLLFYSIQLNQAGYVALQNVSYQIGHFLYQCVILGKPTSFGYLQG